MATPQGEDKLESDVHLQRLEDYVLVESMDKVITMIVARFLLHENHTHPPGFEISIPGSNSSCPVPRPEIED